MQKPQTGTSVYLRNTSMPNSRLKVALRLDKKISQSITWKTRSVVSIDDQLTKTNWNCSKWNPKFDGDGLTNIKSCKVIQSALITRRPERQSQSNFAKFNQMPFDEYIRLSRKGSQHQGKTQTEILRNKPTKIHISQLKETTKGQMFDMDSQLRESYLSPLLPRKSTNGVLLPIKINYDRFVANTPVGSDKQLPTKQRPPYLQKKNMKQLLRRKQRLCLTLRSSMLLDDNRVKESLLS